VAGGAGSGASAWNAMPAATATPPAGDTPFPPHARLHGARRNGVGRTWEGFLLSIALSFVSHTSSSLFCHFTLSGDRPGRRAKGCLQRAATARTADRNQTVHNLAMISIGRMRVMNK